MSTLTKGQDSGGVRYFLEGRPVHAGDPLELRMPMQAGKEVWVRVRFEQRWTPANEPWPGVVLYLGDRWETRFTATEATAIAATRHLGVGVWVVYDHKRNRPVTRSESLPDGRKVYVDHLDTDQNDHWSSRADAERNASEIHRSMQGFQSVWVGIEAQGAELRWRPPHHD